MSNIKRRKYVINENKQKYKLKKCHALIDFSMDYFENVTLAGSY